MLSKSMNEYKFDPKFFLYLDTEKNELTIRDKFFDDIKKLELDLYVKINKDGVVLPLTIIKNKKGPKSLILIRDMIIYKNEVYFRSDDETALYLKMLGD